MKHAPLNSAIEPGYLIPPTGEAEMTKSTRLPRGGILEDGFTSFGSLLTDESKSPTQCGAVVKVT